MPEAKLLSRLARKGANPAKIAQQVIARPEWLAQLLEGLGSETARIKYGSSKVLRLVSEQEPALVYPHIDFFIGLLGAENNFLKWDAIRVVANLATVDARGRVEQILERYLAPIRGPDLITAANTMESAATIARAKPGLAETIARAILKAEWGEYATDECRNIAWGHAITALDRIFDLIACQEAVLKFVRKQEDNTRKATRKKAADFLKKRAS